MRKNFFNQLGRYLRPSVGGTIEEIREQALQTVSWIIALSGILLFFLTYGPLVGNTILYYTSLVSLPALLLVTIFSKRLPYNFRAIFLLTVSMIQGILNMQATGLVSDTYIWLMFSNLLATMLLGIRGGMITNLISAATFIVSGYMGSTGLWIMGLGELAEYNANPENWINMFAAFLLMNLILTLVIGLILRGVENSHDALEETLEENKSVTKQLEEEQNLLAKQTLNLERRVTQIRTAAEIASTMGAILDPDELMQNVADLICDRFDLYYVGIFVVDDNRRFATLAAGTGEAGRVMKANNHQLSVGGSSMVGWTISHGEPRISLDVGTEAIRFQNPNLPLTRSELAIPIRAGNQISGAISIQSSLPEAFDENDIIVFENIGNSLGIALENASLFEQFESSLREIQQLNRQYTTDSWQNIWAEEESSQHSAERGSLPEGTKVNEVAVPLRLRGEQVIGNISLATEQSALSPEELAFVEAISDQAAIALESARLLDEANRRVEQERAIQNLTTRFSRSLDFESLLKTIVEEINQIPLVKETSIHITPPEMLSNHSSKQQN
ncbi:MAG: GAF domain-containing protein [Anaerolineales bacterium]|nr:GAF domain-containing protein [Anaerolineales bacterium]